MFFLKIFFIVHFVLDNILLCLLDITTVFEITQIFIYKMTNVRLDVTKMQPFDTKFITTRLRILSFKHFLVLREVMEKNMILLVQHLIFCLWFSRRAYRIYRIYSQTKRVWHQSKWHWIFWIDLRSVSYYLIHCDFSKKYYFVKNTFKIF